MKLRLALLPLTALAGAAAAATAETAPPRVPDWKQSHLEEGNSAVRSVYILAVCTRNHRRQAAEAFLATLPGSAEEERLLKEAVPFGQTECPILAARVTIRSRIFLRGAIAEAIYNGDGLRPRSASSLPLAEAAPSAGGPPATVGRWTAQCAVRRSPLLAHAVVRGNPGSIRETKALRALEPVLLDCLPAGARLRVSRVNFRAMIAEELYRASLSFKESFAYAKG